MRYRPEVDGPDLLGWWIRNNGPNVRSSPRVVTGRPGGLRFAFYGRMSTEDFQDQLSSARWQRDFADDLVTDRGTIVAEFFDTGVSRRRPWTERPQARRLLAALADPDRGFDEIVVGEFERAFYGDQLLKLAPIFALYGVRVWLPELDGPVDVTNELHLSLLTLLGVHSRREVQRSRFRAKAAMRAQVVLQGRHLGGRPPYGYRLVDAGPHPNRAHARWGRRLLRLEPDPDTARHVRWMFTQRLAGHSVASIARELNERKLPCPSRVDQARNPHRTGDAWTLQTVAAILGNPRYTGRQVWNRQRTEFDSDAAGDDLLGRSQVHRWNTLHDWVISNEAAHPALVSEEDFIAAQAIRTAPTPADGTTRAFVLTGLMLCQLCRRQLGAHWVHGRHGYRCRHGHTTAALPAQDRAKNVYARQDQALLFLAAHVPQLRCLDPADLEQAALMLSGYLASNDLLIRCSRYTWQVQVNGAVVADSWPPRIARINHGRRRSRTAETPRHSAA